MNEAQLIKTGASGKDDVLASGPAAECLRKGASLDAKGEGPLEVWHRSKGILQTFDGRSNERTKRQQKSIDGRSKSQDVRNAEVMAASAARSLEDAQAELARAEEKVKEAGVLSSKADSVVSTAQKAASTTSNKKAAKKKAAGNS